MSLFVYSKTPKNKKKDQKFCTIVFLVYASLCNYKDLTFMKLRPNRSVSANQGIVSSMANSSVNFQPILTNVPRFFFYPAKYNLLIYLALGLSYSFPNLIPFFGDTLCLINVFKGGGGGRLKSQNQSFCNRFSFEKPCLRNER